MRRCLLVFLIIFLSNSVKSQSPCDNIEKYVDEFRNITDFSTPYNPDFLTNFWISKVIEGKKIDYYVHLRKMEPLGKTTNGAFLILANGKRISRPNADITLDIDKESVSFLHPGYIQQADIRLTSSDLLLLKSSPIVKYAFSYLSDSYNGKDMLEMFNCLLRKK